jgi:hypothetical protein
MKYLKLYEEFVNKETKVNFGEAELEIKEMFRIFKELNKNYSLKTELYC